MTILMWIVLIAVLGGVLAAFVSIVSVISDA